MTGYLKITLSFLLLTTSHGQCISQRITLQSQFDSLVKFNFYQTTGKNYELDKSLTKMGYQLQPKEAGSVWESMYGRTSRLTEVAYVSFYCFGTFETKKGVIYTTELLTTDDRYQDYVEKRLSKFKKGQPRFAILSGYEIESGDSSWSIYYGKRGGLFVNGAYQVLITKTGIAKSTDHKLSIELTKKGNLFEIPVTINGAITLNFIIDSGASDVTIPSDVVSTLTRTGTIKEGDFIGTNEYKLADGSTIRSKMFILKELIIGGLRFENINAAISDSPNSPLLLGQNILSRLGRYTIDHDKGLLIVEE